MSKNRALRSNHWQEAMGNVNNPEKLLSELEDFADLANHANLAKHIERARLAYGLDLLDKARVRGNLPRTVFPRRQSLTETPRLAAGSTSVVRSASEIAKHS